MQLTLSPEGVRKVHLYSEAVATINALTRRKRSVSEVTPIEEHEQSKKQTVAHHLADTKDLTESYYRQLINGQAIDEVVSAAQKEWRRNHPQEARYYAALMILSFKVEHIMNRMMIGCMEDISIANNNLLLFAVETHKYYTQLRRQCDQSDRIGRSNVKSWRQDLRNNLELRSRVAQLITAMCRSEKSRITDHIFSVFYDIRARRYTLDQLQDMISPSRNNNVVSFKSMLRDASENRSDYAKHEAVVFHRLAVYFEIARLKFETQKEIKAPEEIARMLLKNFVELSERYLRDEELKRVARALEYMCTDVCLKKRKSDGKFPCKLPFTHWALLFTRPLNQLVSDPVDCESEICSEEAVSRYEAILQKKQQIEIPLYALDRHTLRGHQINGGTQVDSTTSGFYRREHAALEPLSTAVVDSYHEEAVRKAQQWDRNDKQRKPIDNNDDDRSSD